MGLHRCVEIRDELWGHGIVVLNGRDTVMLKIGVAVKFDAIFSGSCDHCPRKFPVQVEFCPDLLFFYLRQGVKIGPVDGIFLYVVHAQHLAAELFHIAHVAAQVLLREHNG